MDVLLVMCLGAAAGRFLFTDKIGKKNEKFQILCTTLLIFSMGVVLGSRENFLGELASLGYQSLLFCLFPTLGSILAVFLLTKKLSKKEEKEKW